MVGLVCGGEGDVNDYVFRCRLLWCSINFDNRVLYGFYDVFVLV